MDVLNDVNLNGNKLTNSVIGSNNTTTAGAIKYNSGSLSYYNGSSWITLGSGGAREVNSFFNISDGTTTYTVQVSPETPSRTVSFTSGVSGVMLVSMIDSSVSRTLTVPTTYIKTTGDIVVGTEYSGGTLITITHGLGTYNIITQVWYKSDDRASWKTVSADITASSENVIIVKVGGNGSDYSGRYKVLIFRGYEQTISAGNISMTGQGSPI